MTNLGLKFIEFIFFGFQPMFHITRKIVWKINTRVNLSRVKTHDLGLSHEKSCNSMLTREQFVCSHTRNFKSVCVKQVSFFEIENDPSKDYLLL